MNNHYVCSECGGVSKQAGVCQTDNCIQQGMELKVCHCDDNKHESVISQWKSDETQEATSSKVNVIDLDQSA
jgi:hypothetical protein